MNLVAIASTVTAVTLVVLTCFLIPTLLEMRKAALALRSVAEAADAQIRPLLAEAREAMAEIRVITGTAATNVEGVGLFMEEIGRAGEHIHTINKVVGIISTVAAGSSAWISGARVAARVIADKLKPKRG